MSGLLIFKNKKGAEAWILRKKEKMEVKAMVLIHLGNAWAITLLHNSTYFQSVWDSVFIFPLLLG